MTEFHKQSVIKRTRDLTSTQVESELVMMDLPNGNYYGLNPVASKIWQNLAVPQSVAQLCESLQAEFDVDDQTCLTEVLQFLDQLSAASLVERVADNGQ